MARDRAGGVRADAGRPLTPRSRARRRARPLAGARKRQQRGGRAARACGAGDWTDSRRTEAGGGLERPSSLEKARAMAQVSVTIDGRKYRLACNEGEEARLESLAGMVDGKIGEMRTTFGQIGDQRLVIMAALTIADSFAEARDAAEAERQRSAAAEERAQAIASSLEALGSRLEALAARLAGGAEA